MESFFGSLWFACVTLLVGYLLAHVAPITWLTEKFKK
jgi:hypothetical protein